LVSRCLSTPNPKDIIIPLDKIELRYSRSSGPGGQNVNKLNTKVEIRFNVTQADWLPLEVRERIFEYNPTRINKEGEIIVTSQENRFTTFYKLF
jgi:peptidyl-tRNA hydrolase ICT1